MTQRFKKKKKKTLSHSLREQYILATKIHKKVRFFCVSPSFFPQVIILVSKTPGQPWIQVSKAFSFTDIQKSGTILGSQLAVFLVNSDFHLFPQGPTKRTHCLQQIHAPCPHHTHVPMKNKQKWGQSRRGRHRNVYPFPVLLGPTPDFSEASADL